MTYEITADDVRAIIKEIQNPENYEKSRPIWEKIGTMTKKDLDTKIRDGDYL